MALANFLSAIKIIITEIDNLPTSIEERRLLYQNKFKNLSKEELLDLAKIPPKQFSIYTGTIFRGETNILKRRFPCTFTILEENWQAIKKDKSNFSAFNICKSLHHKYPWKSYQTNDLALNFSKYIKEEYSNSLKELAPYLDNLLDLEYTLSVVKRSHKNLSRNNEFFLNKELLESLSIEGLLKKEVILNNSTLHSAEYNIIEIRKQILAKQFNIDLISKNLIYYAVNRDKNSDIKITILKDKEFDFFLKLQNLALEKETNASFSISTFALKTQSKELENSTNEKEQLATFQKLFERLLKLSKNEVFYIKE